MPRIRITWASGEVTAALRDTPSVRGLLSVLPCESSASTWGEEVYFNVPLAAKSEADAQQIVDAGTVCFWVQGHALALPFGPTPISRGKECRLVTRCNVLGRLEGDPGVLGGVRDGDAIRVTLIDS
jgi:hypothetical protein